MPNNQLTAAQESGASSNGSLRVSVTSSLGRVPVPNASVTISYTGDPGEPLMQLSTDSSGQTPSVELPAPPVELSQEPENELQPYSEYNILVTAEGYEPVLISGSELFAGELSLQPVRLMPLETEADANQIVVIPAHTLFGDYPPKIPEEEIKPIAETGEIVLSRVVIPEYIIVHDGVPNDATAQNYWVRYRDYIKNVASCEIYSTWPEAAIYANILAIMSFTVSTRSGTETKATLLPSLPPRPTTRNGFTAEISSRTSTDWWIRCLPTTSPGPACVSPSSPPTATDSGSPARG